MNIQNIKGLKYPDEYFIKYFFKNRFHEQKKQRFLEFGCGNGNNLFLPYQYHHDVVGIDFNNHNIENAKYNFQLLQRKAHATFFQDDMRLFVQNNQYAIHANILTLPNIVNYITESEYKTFLKNIVQNNFLLPNSKIFIRFRSPKDFRNGYGTEIGTNCYKVTDDTTSEKGAINRFYTSIEMIDILREYLQLRNFYTFEVNFENLAQDKIIFNSDIVIWGDIL